MQHLFQSTFLQALGYAIANSLWQTALVWLIYMSVTGLLAVSAAAKYRLAVAAQVMGFVWFMITFQFYYHQYSNAWQLSGTIAVSQDIQAIVSSNTDFSTRLINWMIKGEQLLPYVSMAYLLLMLFLCTRWFFGYRQTQLIRNNGLQKMPANWRLFVKKIAAQLGINKEIRIFLSDSVTTPLTMGFLKPVILIPVASINHLTTDQLEAVLLHELAHIKRYDYLVNIILSVVEISLFFNPFTQLLSKSIRKERENSCDDWVLQFKYNASEYAEALLRIAYMQSAPVFAMAASGKKNDLLFRVKRMIHKKENRFSYRRQLLAFFIVTGMLSSIAWLSPMTPHTDQKTIATHLKKPMKNVQQYALEPMAVNVDNPLFNPVFFLAKPLKAEMKKNIVSAQKEMDEAVFESEKENTPFVESVSPMVAGALDLASKAMTADGMPWKKDIAAQIEAAKKEVNKAFRDSAVFSYKFRQDLKKEMNNSLSNMDAELMNAKAEMERSFQLNNDIHVIDKENLQKDIEKGMQAVDELRKIGFDKIVMSALRLPGLLSTDNSRPKMRMRSDDITPPQRVKLRMRKPAKEIDRQTEVPGKEAEETEDIYIDNSKPRSPDATPKPTSSPEIEKWVQEFTTLAKIQGLVVRSSKENKIKILPVVIKEKMQDAPKVYKLLLLQ